MTTTAPTTTAGTGPTPEAVAAATGKVMADATAGLNALLIALGDRLDLWKALAGAGPLTSAEAAARAGVDERYLREWLSALTANGYLVHDPVAETFTLPDELAAVLADETSPALFIGAFQMLPAFAAMVPALVDGFHTGKGVSWHDRDEALFDGEERFSRPLHRGLLADVWLASVPGLVERLEAGARVADVGCGYGTSTITLAERFPRSSFVGVDFHDHSIARARSAARAAGVEDRVRFEVADARDLPGAGYDLVLFGDSLHDMGDPVGAARAARAALAPGGVVVTLDPAVGGETLGERLADPFAPILFGVSLFVCLPASLAQHGPHALGAACGEAAIRSVLTEAGFARVERHGEGAPMNMVIAASDEAVTDEALTDEAVA